MTATLPLTGTSPAVPRRGHGWVVAGLILAVAIVAFGALNVVALLSHTPFDRHHRWAEAVTSLDVSIGDGSVTVVGSGGHGATVHASGAAGLASPSDKESLSHGHLTIRSNCPGFDNDWCHLNYAISVPVGIPVTAHSADGSVRVTGVRGPLTVSSDDGSVNVTGRNDRVTARSDDGNVTLTLQSVPAVVDASSSDGNVHIGVPTGSTLYQVSASSGDGRSRTQVKTAPSSSHRITAHSDDGNVTVAYGSG